MCVCVCVCGKKKKMTSCAACSKPCGRLRCGRCKSVPYCDKACQTKHWKSVHKRECVGVLVPRLPAACTGPPLTPRWLEPLATYVYTEKLRALCEIRGAFDRNVTPELLQLLYECEIVYDGAQETTLALASRDRDIVQWLVKNRTEKLTRRIGSTSSSSSSTKTTKSDGDEKRPLSEDDHRPSDPHPDMVIVALHPSRGAVVGALVHMSMRALSLAAHKQARSSCDYAMDLYHDFALTPRSGTAAHRIPTRAWVDHMALDYEIRGRPISSGCSWYKIESAEVSKNVPSCKPADVRILAGKRFAELLTARELSSLLAPAVVAPQMVLFNLLPIRCDQKKWPERKSGDDVKEDGYSTITTTVQQVFDAEWKKRSEEPPDTVHSFVLLLHPTYSCLLQSYGSHYTLSDWVAFENPLASLPLPAPPARSDRIGGVHSSPYYRGRLDEKQIEELYADLDTLSRSVVSSDSHARTYAKITGVELDASYVPNQFSIVVRVRPL